ncbi:PRC-barrel domain-containing protein [Pontibacter beigongshangensis]|uniref:PRC-barrel domain-containing protein n=1 Tax=Pontibacter beigongshangensis TaxID=2574733 RepID=UPI0016500F48|nr:PRC-barrel domain-containing protein [Pontibacter beigongshangensis]
MKDKRLMLLREMSDYKVAKDSTDVVGWRVVGADGEVLGTVKDLVVDPQLMKVRYLAVLAENKFFGTDKDQHTLIPIGAAALDKRGKNVFVSFLDSRSISRYPLYTGDHVSEDYEFAIRDFVQHSQNATFPETSETYSREFDESIKSDRTEQRVISDDFYDSADYDANRFYTSDQDYNRSSQFTSTDPDADHGRAFPRTDRDVNQEGTYTTSDYERTDTTSDLRHASSGPKSVEDSIATIERLEGLRKRGSITEEEFILMKKRALDQ